jgi:hypothetical protein
MNHIQLILAAAIATAPFATALAQDEPVAEPDAGDSPAEADSEDAPPADEADDDGPETEAAPPSEEPSEPEAAPVDTVDTVDTVEEDIDEAVSALEEKAGSIISSLGNSQIRDFSKESDGWFRPVIGGRWLPDGAGGATVLGVSGGSWSRFTKEDSKVALGLTSRARYEGAIGNARGRVVKTDGRFTFHTSVLRVEAGGGLEASRSKFEAAPQLPGVLGAVADTRVKLGIESFNVLLAARPMWILAGDRDSRTEGPLEGVGDEFSHILGANFFFLSATWTRTYTSSGPIEQVIAGFEL